MATDKITISVDGELFNLDELKELIEESVEGNLALYNGERIIFLDIEELEITGGNEYEKDEF